MMSKRTLAAVNAMLFVAGQGQQRPVRTHEVSAALGFSISYMEGILSELKSHKLLQSSRGPGGGYQVDCSPEDLSIWDIVKVFETPNLEELEDQRKGQEIQSGYLRGLHQAYEQFLRSQTLAQWTPKQRQPPASVQPTVSRYKFKPLPARTVAHLPNSVFQWYKFNVGTQRAL